MQEKTTHGGADRGQGRHALPKEQKMIRVPVEMPPSMRDDLSRIAKKRGKKRNHYIRQVLQHAIDLDLHTDLD